MRLPKPIKPMNERCYTCEGSLMCIAGTIQEIQKCNKCKRMEARWGRKVGKDGYWEADGSLYVTSKCPRKGLEPVCALVNLDPWCRECNARYGNA